MSNVIKLVEQQVKNKSRIVEEFEHSGVTVTIEENAITKRFIAKFVDNRPTPFSASALRLADAKKKAIALIDKMHAR